MREDARRLNRLVIGGVDQVAVGAAELGVETALDAFVSIVGADHPVQAADLVRQPGLLREGLDVVVEIDVGFRSRRAVPVVVF
ncbi:hypothetical protein D3C86_2080740 [compost metagenome]